MLKDVLKDVFEDRWQMRGEVLIGPERRRRWSEDEKARIIEESLRRALILLLINYFHYLHLSTVSIR